MATIPGDAQVVFSTPPTILGFLQAGRLTALSTTTPQGSPSLPNLPGAAEAGLAHLDVVSWHGLFAPKGTPPSVIARLHEAFTKALRTPAVRKRLADGGVDGEPSPSPEAFAESIRRQAPMWARRVKQSAATVDWRPAVHHRSPEPFLRRRSRRAV